MPSAAPARTPAARAQTANARRAHAVKVVRELLVTAAEVSTSRGDHDQADRLRNALAEVERVGR